MILCGYEMRSKILHFFDILEKIGLNFNEFNPVKSLQNF